MRFNVRKIQCFNKVRALPTTVPKHMCTHTRSHTHNHTQSHTQSHTHTITYRNNITHTLMHRCSGVLNISAALLKLHWYLSSQLTYYTWQSPNLAKRENLYICLIRSIFDKYLQPILVKRILNRSLSHTLCHPPIPQGNVLWAFASLYTNPIWEYWGENLVVVPDVKQHVK